MEFWLFFISELVNSSTFTVLVGALVAGWFGFRQYRSQKIWEKIDERYFKKGIEEFISYLQHLRTTTEHNYTYSLSVIIHYRDLNNKDFLEWFDLKKIKENNILSSKMPNSFLTTSRLFKNKHFKKLCIDLFVNIGRINDYYILDCMRSLYAIAENPEKEEFAKKETANKLLEECYQKNREINEELELYNLIDVLEEILFVLRKSNIDSYRKLEQVHKNKEIKELLKKLESIKSS